MISLPGGEDRLIEFVKQGYSEGLYTGRASHKPVEQVKEISDEETHAGPFTQGWKPARTKLDEAEQIIGRLLHENGGLKQQIEQFNTVYTEFNNLICCIGFEGWVDADSPYVSDAVLALERIEGGEYAVPWINEKHMQRQKENKRVEGKRDCGPVVAWMDQEGNPRPHPEFSGFPEGVLTPLYADHAQKVSVPMTEDEILNLQYLDGGFDLIKFARAIEAHHKIGTKP